MISIFRGLIITNVILYTALIILPYIDSAWLSEKELDVLSYSGYGAYYTFPSFILWGIFVVWVLSMLGLIYFYDLARKVFLWWLILTSLLTIGSGLDTRTALQAFLANVSTLLDGAIIVMAYFTSVENYFKTKKRGT